MSTSFREDMSSVYIYGDQAYELISSAVARTHRCTDSLLL